MSNPLRVSREATEAQQREAILACGRLAYERGLMRANDGNISIRMEGDRILITPSGVCKGRMEPEEVLVLSMAGEVISAGSGGKPSSETPMHLEVYRQRTDVGAVLHAHPVFATALTVADVPFPEDILPEVLLTLGTVPTTRYATPSSHDDALAIRALIRQHDALLLRQHGSLTVGADLEAAMTHLERIEHAAEVFWRAQLLGTVRRIPEEEKQRLKELRDEYFSGA